MKLRTLFCEKTVLRKDLTRFAPLWALYLIAGLLVFLPIMGLGNARNAADFLEESLPFLSVVNLIYAMLVAQVLFGDLFNARMCNALHALPMRRETWFFTHVLAGLVFSAGPHLVASVLFTASVGVNLFVVPLWLLGMLLQYLFFFGLAVLCMLCSGNRFAALALYAIVNFLSLILWWFLDTVYIPQLYGVKLNEDIFLLLCPVVEMCRRYNGYILTTHGPQNLTFQGLGDGFGYCAILAAIGVVFLVLALLLYRRRRLETAGDFLAVRALEPVFSVVFTLCVAAVFAMFGDLVMESYITFLIIGMVVGFFVGQMLLRRTVKVFRAKAWGRLGIIAGVLLASIFIVALDPFASTRWVPKPEDVQFAYIDTGTSIGYQMPADGEDAQKIIALHKMILETEEDYTVARYQNVAIRYVLQDGRTVDRTYKVPLTADMKQAMRSIFSTPQYVLGIVNWDKFATSVYRIYVEGEIVSVTSQKALLEAVKKDFDEGSLSTVWALHEDVAYTVGLEIAIRDGNGGISEKYVTIYSDARHTAQWLKDHDMLPEYIGDKYY
jgi:ABC-2 type transport system permease protein